jgi:hypothetical protein
MDFIKGSIEFASVALAGGCYPKQQVAQSIFQESAAIQMNTQTLLEIQVY